jgi:RHS repeat-associated protein
VANATGTTVWRWDQAEPFGSNPADENPSGLGAFDLPLRLPGQRYDKETGLHYNYYRDYDSGLGRYIQSDPVGLIGGLNTYAYVAQSPLSLVDLQGLATFENFPPAAKARMQSAVEEAIEKLRTCDPTSCERTRKELDDLIRKIENANYLYEPNSEACGRVVRFPFFVNTIRIGPAAFSFEACCDLSSTIAHEGNHLRSFGFGSASEEASRLIESGCFNCPRPQQ